jgi:hypothetical protein
MVHANEVSNAQALSERGAPDVQSLLQRPVARLRDVFAEGLPIGQRKRAWGTFHLEVGKFIADRM